MSDPGQQQALRDLLRESRRDVAKPDPLPAAAVPEAQDGREARIYFDTEFIEDGRTIDLLSIGLIRDDGATYYAEPAETDRARASAWVAANVLPYLTGPVKPRAQIARELIDFAGPAPEFWAWYADYDWVALCQLFGTMMDLPPGWPMFCRDFRQVTDGTTLPAQGPEDGPEHNALADARWLARASAAVREGERERQLWRVVEALDRHLDEGAAETYQGQPLAQDWARVAKVTEEAGEAIDALIGVTGQNPRKGYYGTRDDLFSELADVALTGVYAIQHFTKDIEQTRAILLDRADHHAARVGVTPAAPSLAAPEGTEQP